MPKRALEHLGKFLKIRSTLERGFPRLSGHADKEASLELGLTRASGLQTYEKLLDA